MIFFVIGWLLLAGLLLGLLYLASAAREGIGLLHLIHLLLMWVLAPGFGGFCATYVTRQVIKGVRAETVAIAFISIVITLAVMIYLPLVVRGEEIATGQPVVSIAQLAAIIIGSRIGWAVNVVSQGRGEA
ncbi:MAG: hypothetical protein WAN86_00530 [Hyphomicrobiaceae bacterium]